MRAGGQWIAAAGCLLALGAASPAQAQHSHTYVGDETVAFEDVAAAGSDADQNDVVVRYNKRCEADESGDLVEEQLHLVAVAAGATLDNRLELRLPTTPSSVTLSVDGGTPVALTPDAGDRVVLADPFASAFDGAPTGFVNTEPGATVVPGRELVVLATYPAGHPLGGSCPPADLLVTRSGVVIDEGTTLAANQQPAVARLPATFEVARERVPLGQAYPDFLTWLADSLDGCDGTCAASDWYTTPVIDEVVPRPSLATTAPLPDQQNCSDGVQSGDETGVDCGGDVCPSCQLGTQDRPAASCAEIDATRTDPGSGVYWLQGASGSFEAYCDMETDGGGWTLVSEGHPVADAAANLCTTGAVGAFSFLDGSVSGPVKLSNADINAVWGSTKELLVKNDAYNTTGSSLAWDRICIADFTSAYAWHTDPNASSLSDLDAPTLRCLVGGLADDTLDNAYNQGHFCGYTFQDGSDRYLIYSATTTYSGGDCSTDPAGRSWLGPGNWGCNTWRVFVR